MKKVALPYIDSFGRSEERGSYCIYLKPKYAEKEDRVTGTIHLISRDQADALHTFLKAMNDPDIIVKFPEWRTLTLGEIQISAFGDVCPSWGLIKEQDITVDNYRKWADEILRRSNEDNFPRVVSLPSGGFLSTEGKWSLVPRANDFVLAYLRQEFSDATPPSNVAALAGRLRNIFKSELVKNGALYFEGDGIHCDLGAITNAELLYIAESLTSRK